MADQKASGPGSPRGIYKTFGQLKDTKKPELSQNHKAALAYAKMGFYVFPVVPGGKRPITSNGFKDATRDPSKINEWWLQYPDANVGISCEQSKIAVVDVDHTFDLEAIEALAALEEKYGKLPPTPIDLTPSGGFHFYFTCSTPIPSRTRVLPNIDIKSGGGYVVAPPSLNLNGKKYEWDQVYSIRNQTIAEAPSWLVELAGSRQQVQLRPDNYWTRFFKAGADEGNRNDSITKLIGYFLRKELDPYLVREIVHLWNQHQIKPPLPMEEVDRTLDSIARLEVQRRRAIHEG